jgi:hypothetical protein
MRMLIPVVFSLPLTIACSGGMSAPATPVTPTPVTTLSGTWTGTSSDASGQEIMTWGLSQNGNAVSGTLSISDAGRGMMGNGSMQGTMTGSTMTFHMAVPNGGFGGMMAPCAMGLDGQATLSDDGHTMTGTYSGSMSGMMSSMQSCGGPMNGGHFTLTR